ncbi:helix-turn-helix domain-containing protein [Herbiconiux sp. CPCC 205763]|uniref:Helix-turn-helix domain-containing protein n=1 Tax=Herbiconiux aconitum TaxID=2970913 RepID=A0ABT2GPY8_9MICO|nr:helix-turn-helix transcriptional regulator [Herbiconiux aconitum]MCS5718284.1 helix-turn-helix domain-containing protein [Herbiconiux aconitum]
MRATIASPQDLGRVVQRLRARHGLSQRELAQRLGTSQRYVYELEAGKPKTADARYFRLLGLLGIQLTAETTDD